MLRRATQFFLVIGAIAAGLTFAQQQVITTIAGTPFTFPPSPLPALNAPLGRITGVAVDANGSIYIADSNNNLVERFVPGGQMTVVAGNGIAGFSGDGGLATAASLNAPNGVAVDSAGNLYIADTSNQRIRKVSSGIITTVAGDGASGQIFVDPNTGRIPGDGGPATSATLYNPQGVATDSAGNLYIADTGDGLIRKVSSGIIETAAGASNQEYLFNPVGVAVDSAGNLYVAEAEPFGLILKVSGGTVTKVAGGGSSLIDGVSATSASLSFPTGVALDSAGNLYIADSQDNRIRKVSEGTITTVAGTGAPGFSGDGGSATSALLFTPLGVAADPAGNLYIADAKNERIRKVSGGTITTVAGSGSFSFSGDRGPAISASLLAPVAAAVDAAGSVYIADQGNLRVRKVSSGIITTVAGNGIQASTGDGGPAASASLDPVGVAVDLFGNLYIADSLNNRIRKVSAGTITTVAGNGNPGFSGDDGLATSASLDQPNGVAVDSAGNLYIADTLNQRIRMVSSGIITTVAGNAAGFEYPYSGFYVGFSGDGGPATSALLYDPSGVAVDSVGNLYIADTGNQRIRKVSGGKITTVAGNGGPIPGGVPNGGFSGDGGPATAASLNGPSGVTVDSAGNFYIADLYNNRIRKVSVGIITTVAGGGNNNPGDGGPATSASLNSPQGTAVDSVGNFYVADTGNNRIREVQELPPTFTVLPLGLSFTAVSGGVSPPPKTIQIVGSVPDLAFAVQGGNAPWLTLSAASGLLPFGLQVGVDPSQLTAGPYADTVVITVPGASTAPIRVPVSFTVTATATQKLAVSDQSLSFDLTQGGGPATSQLTLTNLGSGSLNFTASTAVVSGGNWISISPANGSITAASPVSLTVNANPGALTTGTYTATITITSPTTGQVINVSATLAINMPQPKIVLSQLGFTFIAVARGGTVLPQSLGIVNGGSGSGSMNWTTQLIAASGSSCGFLDLSTPSGSLASPLIDSAVIGLSVNAQGLALAPGSYYCLVQVSSPTASNSPQSALVVLDVLAAGVNPGPNVQPSGLVFTSVAAAENPGSQIVQVADVTAVDITFESYVTYGPGASGWLQYLPLDATVTPGQATPIVIQPDFTGLSAGVYQATLSLNFDDGSIRPIVILAVIAPAGTTPGTPATNDRPARTAPLVTGCSPTTLNTIFTLLGAGPTVPVGYPAAISVTVVDDCSNLIDTGSVVASFNNGDVPLPLMDMRNGQWSTSWTPGVVNATGVTVTLKATSSNLSGGAQETVGLASGESQPIIASQPVSAVTLTPGPFAPGDLMLIQGTGLADAQASSSSTVVAIGAQAASLLYASPTQVIVQVPAGVAANTTPQLAISRDTTTILLPSVSIAATHPAILSKDGTGQGQALIYNANTSAATLADASNPSQVRGTVIIYCSGLGSMDSQGNATNTPTVTIGGVKANVTYSGKAPTASYPPGGAPMLLGLVSASLGGLYQITATVPTGVATGSAPVIISSAGQISQAGVTMMVAATGSSPSQPAILTGGIVNAASYAALPVSPGALVAIFTSALAAQPASFSTASLPSSLGGVSVSFNGVSAPMVGVSPAGAYPFISAQVPFEVLNAGAISAEVPVVVTVNGVPSAAAQTQIVASSPGIFTIPPTGQGNAVLVNLADYSIAAPAGSIPGLTAHPIPRGQSAFFYVTGLGAMTPSVADGSGTCPAANGLCNANALPTVLVGGIPAQATAVQAPGFPGVVQINIAIPQTAPTGSAVSLVVKSKDGTVTSNAATIAVQ